MTKIHVEDTLTAQAAAPAKKTVQMPVGVPGYTLTDEVARSPGDRAAGVADNKDLKYVGQVASNATTALPRYRDAHAIRRTSSCPACSTRSS